MRGTIPLLLAATVFAPSIARAQTSDALWRSWQALDDVTEPRAAGFGGAVAAIADDASTVRYNPAGLTRLPKIELAAGLITRGSDTRPNGDTLDSVTTLGSIAGGLAISSRWAIGAYLSQSTHQHITLINSGGLDFDSIDGGGAVAWHPAERIHVGARLTVRHLRLSGAASQDDITVGTAASGDEIAGDAGVLVQLTPDIYAAATYRRGVRWSGVERTAVAIDGATVDPGSTYQVALPSVVAAALAWRPSPRWTLAAQLDYVALGAVDDTLSAADPSNYQLEDALEPRAGAEYSIPLSNLTVQVRAGVYSRAARCFLYVGPDARRAADWPGDDRAVVASGGGSIVTHGGHRLDLAVTGGGGRTAVMAGGALRF